MKHLKSFEAMSVEEYNKLPGEEVFFGVYSKKYDELLGVFASKQTDKQLTDYIDNFHDNGYVVKKISKEQYNSFDLGDEMTLDELKTKLS